MEAGARVEVCRDSSAPRTLAEGREGGAGVSPQYQTPTKIHKVGLGNEGERRKYRCSEVENRESKVGESNQHIPEYRTDCIRHNLHYTCDISATVTMTRHLQCFDMILSVYEISPAE